MHINNSNLDTERERERERVEKQSEVVLFGMWASFYCTKVELALKLKGISYERVEEDLSDKSELLLQYNPVHKKVPVLVHKGKPIAESLVILEYIDEVWNTAPKLLPDDPLERAKLRFWANFYDQKLKERSIAIIKSTGKEQEKANEDLSQLVRVLEEGLERDFQGKSPFVNGETLGYLGIVVGSSSCRYEAFNEAVGQNAGPEKNPVFVSWMNALKDHELMKQTLPPHDKLVAKIRSLRHQLFPSPQA